MDLEEQKTNEMGSPDGSEPSAAAEVWQVADADVANAQYVRTLVAGLSWADLPELIGYARFLRARKAA